MVSHIIDLQILIIYSMINLFFFLNIEEAREEFNMER